MQVNKHKGHFIQKLLSKHTPDQLLYLDHWSG